MKESKRDKRERSYDFRNKQRKNRRDLREKRRDKLKDSSGRNRNTKRQ